MSWIVSLILIGIIVWLFMNGLNEKQWVDAHSHDEKVAQDPGLFASFSSATGTGSGKLEGDTNAEKFQNAKAGVKAKAAETSEKLGEKLAAARNSDKAGQLKEKTGDLTAKASEMTSKAKAKLDDSDMFAKVKDNVKKGVDKLGEQVDSKIVGRKKPEA